MALAASPHTPRPMQSPVTRQRKQELACLLSAFDDVFATMSHAPEAAAGAAAAKAEKREAARGAAVVAEAAAVTGGPVYRGPPAAVASMLAQGGDVSLAAPHRRSKFVSVYIGAGVSSLQALGVTVVPRTGREGRGLYVVKSTGGDGKVAGAQLFRGDKIVAVRRGGGGWGKACSTRAHHPCSSPMLTATLFCLNPGQWALAACNAPARSAARAQRRTRTARVAAD